MENKELNENSVMEEHMVKGGLVLEGGGMRGIYTAGVLDYFLEQKRRRKVRLAFLRLLYDKGLAEANRKELTAYLLSHTKGCESEETWLVLKEEHGEDMEYISLFADLGCLTTDNFDAILLDLGAEHPQMKAFLMKYKEEHLEKSDFFGKLSLDL